MKKLILILALALTSSGIIATPAHANTTATPVGVPGPIQMCAESPIPPCFKSLAIKGAGLVEWTTLSNYVPDADNAESIKKFVFETSGTGYSPAAGFGSKVLLSGYGLTTSNHDYSIFVESSDGTSQVEAYGTYYKFLDPSTEIKLVLDTGSIDTSQFVSVNRSFGSSREYSGTQLTLTGKVGRTTHGADFNGPANQVRSGVIQFSGYSNTKFPGLTFDTDASGFSAPFISDSIWNGIRIDASAVHFLTDGVTLNSGYYSSVMPASFLSFYGASQELILSGGISVVADYGGMTVPLTSSLTAEPNGAVRITASGFHYSTPTIITSFNGRPQSANVGAAVKKGKKLTLPLKSTQGIATSWKSNSPKICKVTSTKKTTKKKVGKKTVKTVTITRWQVQGKKKGTCTVVGTNAGNGTFGPASISKSITVR